MKIEIIGYSGHSYVCIKVAMLSGYEIIIKNNNGIIISPKSEIELKNAMILIKNNSNLRETLKGNARKMIITRYDKNVLQQALLEEYYRLLLEKNKI